MSASPAKTWNWGIFGTGRISHDFLGAIQSVSNARIVAICGSDFGHTKAFAAEHGISRVYDRMESFLKDPEIEFLYIATAHDRHKAVLLKAIAAKKSILCEKPLTCNLSETLEVISAAREQQCFLMHALWSRYFPATLQIRGLIRDGVIGNVQVVSATMSIKTAELHPKMDQSLNQSALLDLGIYPISFATMVFGHEEKPSGIKAAGVLDDGGLYDMSTFIHFVYPSGGQAFLNCSTSYSVANSLIIQGTKGTITIPDKFWCPTSYSVCLNHKVEYIKNPETDRDLCLPSIGDYTFNHANSEGLAYEIAYAQCLVESGKLESDQESLDETIAIFEIFNEVTRQLGLDFVSDGAS